MKIYERKLEILIKSKVKGQYIVSCFCVIDNIVFLCYICVACDIDSLCNDFNDFNLIFINDVKTDHWK